MRLGSSHLLRRLAMIDGRLSIVLLSLVFFLSLSSFAQLVPPVRLSSSGPSIALPHPNATTTRNLLSALTERTRQYKILSDNVVYDKYARVYSRRVQFPNAQVFAFDVWGRVWKNDSFSVVIAVPFHRATQTFTLIREYNIAHGRFVYSFPQGCVEHYKHPTIRHAAIAELQEEAHLQCHQWHNLLADDTKAGAPQDKYQRESVFYLLCTEAVEFGHGDSGGVDQEEDMDIVKGVSPGQFRELVAAGALQSNNMAAGLMAIERLRSLGHLPIST